MNTNDTEKPMSCVMGMLINAVIFLTEWHLAMGILPLRRLCCGRIKLGDCEQQKSKRCLRETKFSDGDVLATHRRRKNTMRCFRETHPRATNRPNTLPRLLSLSMWRRLVSDQDRVFPETVGVTRADVGELQSYISRMLAILSNLNWWIAGMIHLPELPIKS